MSPQRRQYSLEFKLAALELSQNSGKPDAEIERDLGIPYGALYRWKKQLAAIAEQAIPVPSQPKANEALVHHLQGDIKYLTQIRDSLKEVLSIVLEESR